VLAVDGAPHVGRGASHSNLLAPTAFRRAASAPAAKAAMLRIGTYRESTSERLVGQRAAVAHLDIRRDASSNSADESSVLAYQPEG